MGENGLEGVSRPGSLGRFFLFFALFSLVPVAIAGFLSLYAISLETQFRQQAAADLLERDLSGIIRRIDPQNYVEGKFRLFTRQLFRKPVVDQRLRNLWKHAQKRWGFEFDAYVFSESGKLITPESMSLKTRYAMQKVWDIVAKTPKWKPKDHLTYKKLINNWLGSDFIFPFMQARRGKVMVTNSPGTDAALFWERNSATPHGGVLLIAWGIPSHAKILGQFAKRPAFRGISLLSLNASSAWNIHWNSFGGNLPPLPELTDFPQGKNRFFREELIWLRSNAGETRLLAGRAERHFDLNFLRYTIQGSAWLVLVLLAVFWYRRLVLMHDFPVPIRTKLILLFLFSLIVPLMGVSFLGFRMLRDREEVLITEKMAQARETLNALDNEFIGEMDRYRTYFRKFRDDPDMINNPQRLMKKAVTARDRFFMLRYETRNLEGKIVLSTDDDQNVEGLLVGFESMAKSCIERYLPERLKTLKVPPLAKFDLVTSMILQSQEMGMSTIMDRPDRVHPLRFGTNDLFWYWDVFRDPNNPAAFITMAQSRRYASRWFLQRRLQQRFGANRLLACWNDMDVWYPTGFAPNAELKNLMDQLRISRQPVIGRVTLQSRRYHVLGIPGNNIKNHGLLALFPETEIQRQIVNLRFGIFFGILLALLVAGVTGFALSDTFLKPIGELRGGLDALSQREMTYRVPVMTRDELGELSQTFNYMMEELKEMAMARIVQESLFPKTMPVVPGYQADLVNIPASDLGGDYCDALPMSQGRLLFAIGDVTGHGASSALLMAMAKAITFEYSESTEPIPHLLKDLNEVTFTVLKRKKMMTFFAAILDPQTHTLTYSAAGHPFPFLCRSDGTVAPLALVHLPLGMPPDNPRARFSQATATMEPGSFIVLFTDGLVETMNQKDEVYGYERLEHFLPQLRHLTASQIKQAIVDDFYHYRGLGLALDDDLTLGVLKRDV